MIDYNDNRSVTEEDAVAVRIKKAAGTTTNELCKEYNLSVQQIKDICQGLYWPHSGGSLSSKFRVTAKTVVAVLEDLRFIPRLECARKYGISVDAVDHISKRNKERCPVTNPLETMKIISSKGNCILVDAEDYDKVKNYSWVEHSQTRSKTVYVSAYIQHMGRRMFMHSFLMETKRGQRVDHKNGNGLDNRRSQNLRLATHQQNMQNSRTKETNRTGLKGVQAKISGRFSARIRDADGNRLYLGTFDTPQQAHKAYCQAALKYHGDFACTL